MTTRLLASFATSLGLLALVSCSSDATSDPPADAAPDQAASDSGHEASPDAGLDATADAAADGSADAPVPPLDAEAGPDSDAPACTPGQVPALKLTSIASGLSAPVFAASPAGDARLFIVEQGGRIRIVQGGAVLPTPFLDVSALISTGGERGLLGLAMHPGYASNGRFWINYTDTSGNTAVVEYKASTADPNVADPQPVRVLLGIAQPFANHNGGMLAFGPDGYLYIGMGDGGSGGDPQGNGQNPQSELGKILRVDVDSYPTPPPGNMPGANPHVWDLGVRNPWRFSFDRATGDLYIADVGQNAWEEVNVEPAGQGHRNYGWNTMEGTHCYQPSSGCSQAGLTLPVAEYSHDNGCSITGGYAYRGAAIPCLQGRYLYADYCSHRIWSFVWNGTAATDPKELTAELDPGDSITSFGEDAQGEAYVVTAGGTIFKIEGN